MPSTTTVLSPLMTILDPAPPRRCREPVRPPPRSLAVTTPVWVFLRVVVRGLRNRLVVSELISVDVITDSVPLVRLVPVRLDAGRRAVLRSTTRAADEVFRSNLALFLSVERSPVAIRPVRFSLVFSPTSIIFIRDVRASALVGVGRVVLAVSRVDARP